MESKLIEFHHFHRTGKRRRGVIHVIVNPWLRKIYVGWSLCNRGAGDYFDPQVGKDIARKRCLKLIDRDDSWRDVSPMTTSAVYETGKETIPSYEWQLYMKTGMGEGGVPVSMYNTLDGVAERIYRVINSVERNRTVTNEESFKNQTDSQTYTFG